MTKRLCVLLTNDDGYPADGLRRLYHSLTQHHDVTVVAPEREQSGVSHAFTYHRSFRARRLASSEGMNGFVVCGTPCDCVKLGLAHLLETKPDVVVSGINVGENTGMAGHYSGTLAAAREAAFWRVTGIAFSVCEEGLSEMDACARTANSIVERLLEMHNNGIANEDRRIFFNVNFPACGPELSKGVKITRQSLAFFDDRYRTEQETDAATLFRLYGERKEPELSNGYDSRAVENGYIAITPLHYDATADEALGRMLKLENKFWRTSET